MHLKQTLRSHVSETFSTKNEPRDPIGTQVERALIARRVPTARFTKMHAVIVADD